MIKIEKVNVHEFETALRGMRNPYNSWDLNDSGPAASCDAGCEYVIGENDWDLAMRLKKSGASHRKFERMIIVGMDITAPLYWWKEFDTYKVGTVADSCSTMHTIHAKEFTLDDFSHEHLLYAYEADMNRTVQSLNAARKRYLETKDKTFWWQMIQLLPSSYNQKRTVMLSYEVLIRMYEDRKFHKLDEWRDFCKWIETLPYSDLICGERGTTDD